MSEHESDRMEVTKDGDNPTPFNREATSSISVEDEVTDELDFLDDCQAWSKTLNESAFHGLTGDIVRLIEPHTEADPAAVLLNILVIFGNAVGMEPHFIVSGSVHRLKLNSVLVGATSRGKKGTSVDPVVALFKLADDSFGKRMKFGLSSGEGLIYQVRDQVIKSEPMYEGQGAKKRPTGKYNEVIIDEGVPDKRLLILESEFGSVLKVGKREGNTLTAVIRSAWDGNGGIRTLTKNPLEASESHISIMGHITKEELKRLISQTDIHNGFANRFLWFYVQQSKSLPSGGEFHKIDVEPIVNRIRDVLLYAHHEMPKDNSGNTLPMEIDSKAYQLWEKIYQPIQIDVPGIIGAVTSRVIPYVKRLACVYAIIDQTHIVRKEHLQAALAIWEYSYKSVQFIFGKESGLHDLDILKVLDAFKSYQQFTLTDIHVLFNRHKSKDEIKKLVTRLLEDGHLQVWEDRGTGKKKNLFRLNEINID